VVAAWLGAGSGEQGSGDNGRAAGSLEDGFGVALEDAFTRPCCPTCTTLARFAPHLNRSCKGWAIVVCNEDANTREVQTFQNQFQRIAGERRVDLGPYQGMIEFDRHIVNSKGVEALLERACDKCRVGLLVCVLGNSQVLEAP
jgi:hypothetical protein